MPELIAHSQAGRVQEAYGRFVETPLSQRLERSLTISPEENALCLFHEVARTVPAYQAFLKSQGVDPASIGSFSDFQRLPLLTKPNYVHYYPLKDLCRNGRLDQCDMIAVSSGSTGKPTFWPRFLTDELEIATRFEQVFADAFKADEKATLAMVCFTLGTWVGGMYTASCCRHLAAKGYPVTVVTPGNNKEEIYRVLEDLGPQFDQVVLLGYPPFLKDVIDTGKAQGVEWSRYHIKLVMAGEVFSEEWRTLVSERLGVTDILHGSASLYGTADAGVLGNETPLSIAIRRFFAQNPWAVRDIFGEFRLPTLVQYDPMSRFFEVTDNTVPDKSSGMMQSGTLTFTGDNGIPLIRYHIADKGGIIPFDYLVHYLKDAVGFDAIAEVQKAGNTPIRKLPFVYVFGRSNFIVSYFGANLYPENITVGLEQPVIKDWVTGKFVMESKEDADKNRYLSVVVELAPHQAETPEMVPQIAESIKTQLKRLNSEFANYVPDEYQTPQVALRAFGDPDYFPVGVKHRYTRGGER